MIEIRGITKKYKGMRAVDNVSFEVKPSGVVGLLGPNGAGKTTIIKMLAGLLEPTDGEIFFQGKNIRDNLYQYKKIIGYVPEEQRIYTHMSACEYLLMVGRLRCIPEKILKQKIVQFMQLLDLSTEMHSAISSYSKGMTQKVLLSAALLHNPDILLLDEPLSGLDVETSIIIKKVVERLSQEGKIVLFSSHILEQVEKICKRVIIIHKGKIVANETAENLRNLMRLSSLEEIFTQLVLRKDSEKVSHALVDVMKL